MQRQKNQMSRWRIHIHIYITYLLPSFVFYCLWTMGRPDMALFKFTKNFTRQTIEVYNEGNMYRDLHL